MADNLSDIVEVFISRESTAIDTASFSIPMILDGFTNFSERSRVYTDITSVGSDFATTSNVYIIAQKLFSGESVKPSSIVVGRRQIDGTTITPVVANNSTYVVTVNGVAHSYTSDASATAEEIVDGLIASIGTVQGVTITDGVGTFEVAPTTPGAPWSVRVSSNLTAVDDAPTETWTAALNAVDMENSSWYALVAATHVTSEQLELATAIQSMYKIYGTSTQDPVALTTGTTDILSRLSADSLSRTFAVYTAEADTDYPEAAWISTQLPETPGSNDWDMKQASGVTVSNLSPTAKANVVAKNGNVYTTRAGVNVFQYGNMSDGSPIDELIFLDWLRARWQEAVVFRFINSKKVPYTRVGATIIENDIRGVMALGVTNGGIADAPAYTVTAPDPLKVSPTLRAQRVLGDFLCTFRLAGSLRKVIIRATASV